MRKQNEYKEMSEIEKSVRTAEEFEKEKQRARCDWDDPEDREFLRKSEDRKNRERTLNRFVKDRRCPHCKGFKIQLNQWVILRNKIKGRKWKKRAVGAICRACYNKFEYKEKEGEKMEDRKRIDLDFNIFTSTQQYLLDGTLLKRVRRILKVSEEEFSEIAGWDRSRQRTIEKQVGRVFTPDEVFEILEVLQRFNIYTKDTEFFEELS